MNFDTRLLERMVAGDDPLVAAKLVLSETPREELEEMVLPAVTQRARTLYRNHVRGAERRAAENMRAGVPAAETARVTMTGTGFRFSVPGLGGLVMWEEATPEQLDLRAQYLEAIAVGIKSSANYYREVARDLRRQGLSCVGDTAKPPEDDYDYDYVTELGVDIS